VRLLRHDLHTLTGVYALDALETDAERNRFERHIDRCQSCESEVRGLRETATRLGMAAALVPPPGLRAWVMAAVARTRQLPAVADPARPARRSRLLPRVAVATAAAGLAAALGLGIALVSTQHQLDSARAQNQAIAAVLAAPDAHLLTGTTSAGGTATVVVSIARHQMVVTTSGLPRLPASKVYQLWLIGPPGVRSAGLLTATVGGRTQPVLTSGVASGDKVGLTVEPAGGTTAPTTTPILVLPLPA
jgi:Anti-sigma-K factor rskA